MLSRLLLFHLYATKPMIKALKTNKSKKRLPGWFESVNPLSYPNILVICIDGPPWCDTDTYLTLLGIKIPKISAFRYILPQVIPR